MRLRRPIYEEGNTAHAVALPGRLVAIDIGASTLARYHEHRKPDVQPSAIRWLVGSGDALGLVEADGTTHIEIADRPAVTTTCSPDGSIGLRQHDGLLTIWYRDGRLAVIDSGELRANFRTRL
jgi:hypothetical protein